MTLPQKTIQFNQNMIQTGTFVSEGGMYALDDLCGAYDTLAARAGERLHDWRIHSYTAGYRNCCGVDENHSGAKTVVIARLKS